MWIYFESGLVEALRMSTAAMRRLSCRDTMALRGGWTVESVGFVEMAWFGFHNDRFGQSSVR
jgi:hypothetical protein